MTPLIAYWKRKQPTAPATRWEDHFAPGEHLVWEGAPSPHITIRPALIGLSLFGVPFLLTGAFMTGVGVLSLFRVGSLSDLGLALVALLAFGLPFLGVGILLVVGMWFLQWASHAFIRFAITNTHVYVATSWWTHKISRYPVPPQATIILLRRRLDTVIFHYADGRDADDSVHVRVELHDIPDGLRVHALLRQIQAAQPD